MKLAGRIADALLDGPRTTRQLADEVHSGTDVVSAACNSLAQLGIVHRAAVTHEHKPGRPPQRVNLWALRYG